MSTAARQVPKEPPRSALICQAPEGWLVITIHDDHRETIWAGPFPTEDEAERARVQVEAGTWTGHHEGFRPMPDRILDALYDNRRVIRDDDRTYRSRMERAKRRFDAGDFRDAALDYAIAASGLHDTVLKVHEANERAIALLQRVTLASKVRP